MNHICFRLISSEFSSHPETSLIIYPELQRHIAFDIYNYESDTL